MRILVVDDQATNRTILACLLEGDGHEVIQAHDGAQAIELFQSSPIDMVLMDVMMPVMDGLEATRKIKALCVDGKYVPIIFLTALDDAKALSKCLASGGDDFLSKPYNEAVLKAKIAAHHRIRELTQQITDSNRELTLHNSRWERERNIVSHIFNRAMEHNLSDCSNLRSYIAPASTFNGDILLSAPSPSGGLYVFLGDFTGHGLGASIGTLPIANSFDQLAKQHLSVGEIASEFNTMLLSILPDYMFCCATLLELNPQGNSVQLWTGGLPDGYIINADGTVKETLASKNLPLGIEASSKFNKRFEVKALSEGEKIILLTDGIVEAENNQGAFFTEERLLSVFTKGSTNPIDRVLDTLNEFVQGAEQNDDITLVEVSSGRVKIKGEPQIDVVDYEGVLWSVSAELRVKDFQRANPVQELMSILGAQTLLRPNTNIIGLLLSELYSNALEHGILELSSELKCSDDGFVDYYKQREKRLKALKDGYINIHCQLIHDDENELVLRIRVEDSGKGFNVKRIMESAQEDTFGRGITLVRRICKRTRYQGNGAIIEVDFPVTRSVTLND